MIRVERYNESFVRVFAERDIQAEIKDFFTFKAPGYRFHPKYKAKLWDGNISMYNMQTCMLPGGLTKLLSHYADSTQTEISLSRAINSHLFIQMKSQEKMFKNLQIV